MRTVWTMGFVAAAALSFCFPDFIVFRFTQAAIWAIALVGLVILCGVSGQFSFAQAGLFGIGGYAAAILGSHTPLSNRGMNSSAPGATARLESIVLTRKWLAGVSVNATRGLIRLPWSR